MLKVRTDLGEETLDLAEFEGRVVRGEIPPDTPVQFPVVTGEEWVPARDLEIFRGLYSPSRIYFTRYFNLSRFPVLTFALVLVNLAVFLAMTLSMPEGLDSGVTAWMVRFGAKASPLIHDLGETWRLLTANFVHRDVVHIAFNLFVLFNVGGALENAFRPLDFLAIVLASALGTTLLSSVGSDAISAGASGVVFGCFGGVVAFGFKYRDIIPPRYRRFFGGSVVPYVLIFLWIGWMSTGVDNWGHLGGLLGGTAATLVLRPRLLDAGLPVRRRTWLKAGALVLLVIGVVVVGPVWAGAGKQMERERDDEFGLEIAYPNGWRRAITHLGQLGFSNNLPRPTYLQVLTEQRPAPVDLSQVAQDWFDMQLHQNEHAGRVRSVRSHPERPAEIAGLVGLTTYAAFETVEQGRIATSYRLRLFVFARGEIAYTVVLLAPEERFEAYETLFGDMLAQVRVVEPRFLRQARAGVLIAPLEAGVHLRLGEAYRRVGETTLAEAAYREALRLEPAAPAARLLLARLLLDSPARRPGAQRLVDEVLVVHPAHAEALELLADLRLASGDREGAIEALLAAVRSDPDPRLRERLRSLDAHPLGLHDAPLPSAPAHGAGDPQGG